MICRRVPQNNDVRVSLLITVPVLCVTVLFNLRFDLSIGLYACSSLLELGLRYIKNFLNSFSDLHDCGITQLVRNLRVKLETKKNAVNSDIKYAAETEFQIITTYVY